jgi:hypothetical protein
MKKHLSLLNEKAFWLFGMNWEEIATKEKRFAKKISSFLFFIQR